MGSLSGSGTVTSSVAGAAMLNVGDNNQSSTFSGAIQDGAGSVALTKTGTGTLTLSGGGGTISQGTLLFQNGLARNVTLPYYDATVNYSTTDLVSNGLGGSFGQGRSWTSNAGWTTQTPDSAGYHNGTGWIDSSLPTLQASADGTTVAVVRSATDIETFDRQANGQYTPESANTSSLTHANGLFSYTDSQGDQVQFYDFSSGTPTGRQGQMTTMTSAAGLLTYVSAWTTGGAIQEVRRHNAAGSDAESWLYSYAANTGLLSSVQLRQPNGQGGWTVVQQVLYTYYDGIEPYGNLGDLQTATVEDAQGDVLGADYYRYYTPGDANGYVEGLKYVFDPQSYARLCAAVSNPFQASDAQVAPFAQQYFQYDSQSRVTLHAVQGAGGGAAGGIGTYTFAYSESTAVAADTIDELGVGMTTNPNAWQYKTVETLPDGNENLYYANGWGEPMLSVFKDISDPGNAGLDGDQWITFSKYDSQGRLIEQAQPSAVTGYNESSPDLLVYQNGSYEYLSNNSGLIELTDYYTQTTATATTAGGAAGYFEDSKVQEGQLGTPVLQETEQYYAVSGSGTTVYPEATVTVYRNSDGTGAETTAYSYTWFSGTVQEQSLITTLPVISTAENGSGTAETTATWYNIYGQATWTMDADGTIDYAAYDPATGAVVKTINDVNTQDTGDFTGLPTGWTTPAGDGLELITTMQVDALGRTIEQTDPDGNITCTVYNDVGHEVRTYPGWNSTSHTTTGPIEVQRGYWPQAGAPTGQQTMYEETLTSSATPTYNATTNLPTGQETIDQTNIQSLARTLLDAAGQAIEADRYFSLTGVTYSTASPNLGTASSQSASGNYFATLYGYDVEGRSDHVQDPAGTITDTVYDALGRVTSTLIGTNDTPGSSNMVDVQDNVYDNGGVGDGDLTQTTLHPGDGQPDRATQYAYDWRNRQIAAQSGNVGSTTGPISYRVLDNLGEVVTQETFAGNGVTLAGLGATNGVPNPPSSGALAPDHDRV